MVGHSPYPTPMMPEQLRKETAKTLSKCIGSVRSPGERHQWHRPVTRQAGPIITSGAPARSQPAIGHGRRCPVTMPVCGRGNGSRPKFINPKRAPMQIADNKVVAFHYTLTNNAGQTIDSSHQRQEPLTYLHGHGNIIPGLEKALVGKEVGDKLDVTVAPEEGYGERHDGLIQQVPASAFEGAGDELQPGMQ